MPEILILCGIPNSGKSTFAKKYSKTHKCISRDDIRKWYFKKPYVYTKENEKKVTHNFDILYKVYVSDRENIILDNCHTKSAYLDEEIKRVPIGYNHRVVFFDIPLRLAFVRNIWRWIWSRKWVPIDVISNMYENYNKIDKKKYE